MDSRHRQRLAIDFNLFVDGAYIQDNQHKTFEEIGLFWESLNVQNKWGVRDSSGKQIDAGHLERRPI